MLISKSSKFPFIPYYLKISDKYSKINSLGFGAFQDSFIKYSVKFNLNYD